MRRGGFSILATATIACTMIAVATFAAQKTTQVGNKNAASPHVKSEWTIDGANISITYGRPYLKGRTMGKDVDPFVGKEWRTGADEGTTSATIPFTVG